MNRFKVANDQPLDESVLDQALNWMVALQSGTSSAAEQQACQHWRNENPQHELAWQRLAGLSRDMRLNTHVLTAPGARQLLQARSAVSRRTLLKGFAGLSVATALGLSVRERVLLPELFSDYHTATGERRHVRLAEGGELQLDTRTAVDVEGARLALNLGRLLLANGASDTRAIKTANGWIRPAALSRLIISHGLPRQQGTQVQMLSGSALVEPLHGPRTHVDAGQQLSFNSLLSGPPTRVPPAAEAWTQGLLITERMPLGEVLEQLDRYRRGLLRCDPAVAGLQVSGSFSLDQPEASLDLLAKVLPVRVQRVWGYLVTVVPA
jgi:transmembrane sensor